MKRVTVLLAEDHLMVREGFRGLLKSERNIEIVGEAETGREAVQLARKLAPDVVVMDVAMPQLNGLEATRQILQTLPGTRVIMLSAHSDDAYVEEANAAGAAGYLVKQSSSHELCEAIHAVCTGKTFFSPALRGGLRTHCGGRAGNDHVARSRHGGLSSREMEVLQLVAEGKANKEIAAELGISIKTVEKHRQHLMQKLGIHDTAGLTRYAVASGVVENSIQLVVT